MGFVKLAAIAIWLKYLNGPYRLVRKIDDLLVQRQLVCMWPIRRA
jgi:hypothetical protein